MVNRIAILAFSSLFALAAPAAMAGRIAEHPRVNEVNQRLMNQEHRIAVGVSRGQINGWQAARDRMRDQQIARQLVQDQALHNGHVTMGEQVRLNRELDRNSVHIWDQRHD